MGFVSAFRGILEVGVSTGKGKSKFMPPAVGQVGQGKGVVMAAIVEKRKRIRGPQQSNE